MIETDIAIIGGGIAGASVAAELALDHRVVLLEREPHAGYHTSGRSAALFTETYGNATIRALTVGSRAFLEEPGAGFAPDPLLTPRGALHVGTHGQEAELAKTLETGSRLVPSVRALTKAEALAMVPVLRPDHVIGAVLEPDARDIDTNALLQGFLRLTKVRGGQIVLKAEVTALSRDADRWTLDTTAGPVRAGIVVNAAGAWADELAALAGLEPIGMAPKRRTAFVIEPATEVPFQHWPMVISAVEDIYFKPDAGRILVSPADETDSPPTDAQPEEIDVAIAIDRLETMSQMGVRRIVRRWAGLRTFAPDRTTVVGFDPRSPGFFWLAGQGGYGFQTSPAMASVAAGLVRTGAIPSRLADLGVTAEALSPGRFL